MSIWALRCWGRRTTRTRSRPLVALSTIPSTRRPTRRMPALAPRSSSSATWLKRVPRIARPRLTRPTRPRQSPSSTWVSASWNSDVPRTRFPCTRPPSTSTSTTAPVRRPTRILVRPIWRRDVCRARSTLSRRPRRSAGSCPRLPCMTTRSPARSRSVSILVPPAYSTPATFLPSRRT